MVKEKNPSDEMKQSLMNRYGETLIRKLTRQDLAEFQTYLKGQYRSREGLEPQKPVKIRIKTETVFSRRGNQA